MSALHPRVAEIVNELERAQQSFVEFMATLSESQVNAPVPDGKWTIAQHVEHLAIVENSAGKLVSTLAKEIAAKGAQETDDSSVLQSLDKYQVSTVTRRIVAPERVAPREGLSIVDGMARLAEARARMIDAFRRASGLALATASYPHPIFGPIDVYQWGLLAAQHQQRHVALIQELTRLPA